MSNVALGFSNFVDKVAKVSATSISNMLIDKDFENITINGRKITEIVVGHLMGECGREYSVDPVIFPALERHFDFSIAIGGTCTRVAAFLDSLGVQNLLHANARDAALGTVFANGNTRIYQPREITSRVHYILEYSEGELFHVNERDVYATRTDRIILVPYGEKPEFPLDDDFFSAINGKTKILFVCSLNTAASDADIADLAEAHFAKIRAVKDRHSQLRLYFEDCGHHDLSYKTKLLQVMAPLTDIYSCNDVELLDFNSLFKFDDTGDKLILRIMEKLHSDYKIPTIIVHAKDFVVIRGAPDDAFVDDIKFGVVAATHWYLMGRNPKAAEFNDLMDLEDNPRCREFPNTPHYTFLPTKVVDVKCGHALGLGDCFCGAVIASLIKPEVNPFIGRTYTGTTRPPASNTA